MRASLSAVFLLVLTLFGGSAFGLPRAYIPDVNGAVSVIDVATNSVIGTITVGQLPVGVAVNAAGTRVYVANDSNASPSVSVIDTSTNTVIATIPIVVGGNPYEVALNPAGTRLYVADSNGFSVTVIDTATNTVVATIPSVGLFGDSPHSVSVSQDGTFVAVVNRTSAGLLRVVKIDTATNTVAGMSAEFGTTFNFASVHGLATNAHIYAASAADNAVYVLNPATLTVTATIAAAGAHGLSLRGSTLYVGDLNNGRIWVIDTTQNVSATQLSASAGFNATGLALTPDGTRLYVVNNLLGPGTVTVLNAATGALITTVTVGTQPITYGNFIADVPSALPASPPVLINVVATASNSAYLFGRFDGVPNATVPLSVYTATTCGGLPAPGALLTSVSVQTDAAGYFFSDPIVGINTGAVASASVLGNATQSNCLVSSGLNDTWPLALPVTGSGGVLDYIDAPGRARWYKFTIAPGQVVKATISALPADYDVAIFKDIGQAFLSQLAGTTAQLTKLTAEFAPSAFSPSAFSPSAFSPSAFSPDAYSPSAFSPSAFSPSVYAPSAFSPSAFSPSAFSPSAFSPSAFSPSAFSPSAFSPSAFSPSAFSPSLYDVNEIAQAFSSAQTRSLLGVSATVGTAAETVAANTWNNTGSFYVRVAGKSGAYSTATPFSIQIVKGATSCTSVTDIAPPARDDMPTISPGLITLVVTDSSKVALTQSVGGETLAAKLNAFMSRPEIAGQLIDVATDVRVGELKAQAAANPSCPFAKNLVAREIKSIIDSYRANNPGLRYVVIAGNDDAIPFFRYPDETLLGEESGYVPPVSSTSASEASLRGNFILGQDAYGSNQVISLLSTDFPIPGLAVGRLVESPADMAGLIDAYTAINGVTVPHSSLVTGYDFLQDAADAVSSELAQGTNATPVKLITPNGVSPQDPSSWTASDLRGRLSAAGRYDVMFLAGHFSANSLLAADFTSSVITTELAGFGVDLTNTIVFSAGCHSGYNLVDTDAIDGVTLKLDWAQAFAQKKATLIAGTGYQYGDTDFIEYSERLYRNFAAQLRAGMDPVAVGEALVKAKRDYLAVTPDIRGLHEKALLEATVFGLPMLQVNMPAGRTPVLASGGVITPVPVASGPAATLGLKTASVSQSTTLTTNTRTLNVLPAPGTVTAQWLSSAPDGIVTNPAQPTLPLVRINVTPTDSSVVLRGVGFRGGNYADTNNVVPLTGAATTELRGVHTPFLSSVFFPMRLWTPNYYGALAGSGGTNLLLTPAQYRAYDVTQGTSTQRAFQSVDLKLYYSGLTTADPLNGKAALSAAPTIVQVAALPSSGGAKFIAQVTGDPAAAMHEVWVTYTGGAGGSGTWTSIDLQQCVPNGSNVLPAACGSTSDSQFWMGDVASLPANTQYIVQAANAVGLVSLDDNLGRYYSVAGAGTAPGATTLVFTSALPLSVAYGAAPTITAALTANGTPLANKLVTIGVGASARSAPTDATGKATVSLPILALPGTYPLTASFAGDAGNLASSASASITVTQAPTLLTALSSPFGVTLTASVGGKAAPIIEESVRFSVIGPQGAIDVFATTDYLGRATFPPPGLPAGTYTVIGASFDGDATYGASSLLVLPNSYNFQGFYQPVDNAPAVNVMKAGSAVPVNFSLGGNRGLQVFAAGYPISQAVSCTSSAPTDDIEQTLSAGTSSLQYDSTTDRYTYVWKTDKSWAGTCRVLTLKFLDGTQQSANFRFKN
ncbi:MAG TPA: PxKF domain-containing protein [Casimicrobiaceae bacterium]|nr:PxKF domain-containing protein [Casimicrobiaceae bacterium]